jgi:DNA-binding CsgD family transcriptional regulator
MREGFQALSEREKDALRLLLSGHDAKSIANSLGLSIHTVNERLREARRKMGVSSSREAARLLAQAERRDPNFLGDKQFGGAALSAGVRGDGAQEGPQGAAPTIVWLVGGMLIMLLIVGAALLSTASFGTSRSQAPMADSVAVAANSQSVSESAGSRSARAWIALLDMRRWRESWDSAGTLFKSQISKESWDSAIRPVRMPLGPVSSRNLQTITKTTSLPNAPAGEYEVIQFKTNFAQKRDAIETVILAREGSDWKVNGYFIR